MILTDKDQLNPWIYREDQAKNIYMKYSLGSKLQIFQHWHFIQLQHVQPHLCQEYVNGAINRFKPPHLDSHPLSSKFLCTPQSLCPATQGATHCTYCILKCTYIICTSVTLSKGYKSNHFTFYLCGKRHGIRKKCDKIGSLIEFSWLNCMLIYFK